MDWLPESLQVSAAFVDIKSNGTTWSQQEDNKTNTWIDEPMEYTSDGMWNTLSKYIPITCGISQEDELSSLLFCVALNPLSTILSQTTLGYVEKWAEAQSLAMHEWPQTVREKINWDKDISQQCWHIQQEHGHEIWNQ